MGVYRVVLEPLQVGNEGELLDGCAFGEGEVDILVVDVEAEGVGGRLTVAGDDADRPDFDLGQEGDYQEELPVAVRHHRVLLLKATVLLPEQPVASHVVLLIEAPHLVEVD